MNRDEILRDVLLGVLDESSPEVQQLLRHDAGFAEELNEMKRVARIFDAGVEFERGVLADSAGEASDDEVAQVLELLHGDRSRESADPSAATEVVASPSGWTGWWKLAAALVVAAGLGWWALSDAPLPVRPDVLGTTLTLEPAGAITADVTFSWTDDGELGTWYTIVVEDPVASRRVESIDGELRWETTSWTPTPERTSTWPDEVLVTVAAFGPTGDSLGAPVSVRCFFSDR